MDHNVIDRIENVRQWLEQAELDYRNGSDWQGELNLNLAQAELKKAWEESQSLHAEKKVVPMRPKQQQTQPETAGKWRQDHSSRGKWVGLAAVLVLVFLLSVSPFVYQGILPDQNDIAHTDLTDRSPVGTAGVERMVGDLDSQTTSAQLTRVAVGESEVNYQAYDQMGFQVSLAGNLNHGTETLEEKKVIVPTASQISVEKPVQLASREIRSVGAPTYRFYGEERAVAQPAYTEMPTPIDYDVNDLITEAREVLNANR